MTLSCVRQGGARAPPLHWGVFASFSSVLAHALRVDSIPPNFSKILVLLIIFRHLEKQE